MKTSIPWSIKGIEPEARAAAKSAARRSGLTLGQWLNTVILDTGDDDDDADYVDYSHRVPHRNAGRQPAPRYEEEIQDRLDDLTIQISQLTRRQSETAVSRVVEPTLDLEPVTDAVRDLVGRVERSERRSVDTLETFDKRLLQMSERLSTEFAKRESKSASSSDEAHEENFEAFEKALKNIVDHIEQTDRRNTDNIAQINARLGELALTNKSNTATAETEKAKGISYLEQQLAEMAERIERAERGKTDTNAITTIESRVSELSNELRRRDDERTENLESEIGVLSSIESRVSELSNELRRRDSELNNFALRSDLENVASRSELSEFASRSELSQFAPRSELDKFASHSDLSQFASRSELSQFAPRSELDNFASRKELGQFASRSDLKGLASRDDLQLIQARIQEIVNRLDDSSSDAPIARMQQEIALLSEGLSSQKLEAASSAEVQGLKRTIDAVATQLREISEFSADPEVAVQRIEDEITSLSQSVADLSIESASNRELTELRDKFEQIAQDVYTQQRVLGQIDPNLLHQTRAELTALSEMTAQIRNDAASIGDMQTLRETVTQISSQISQLGSTGQDTAHQQALENRLNELARRLDQEKGNTLPIQELGALDQRILELESQLEASRASAVAEDTANALLQKQISELSERIQQAEAAALQPAPPADDLPSAAVGAITALEQSLQSVQENAEKSDKRTQETLEAVHETLEKIVTRLARLEEAPDNALSINTAPLESSTPPSVTDYAEPDVLQKSSANKIGDFLLPPIMRLGKQPAGLSQKDAEVSRSGYSPEPVESQLPDLRLDPIDVQHDSSNEQSVPKDEAKEPETETSQVPADDFIAAARRAAQSSVTPVKTEEKQSKSRFNILRGRNKPETKTEGDKSSKKKTVLLAAAIALLAIGTLSTMNLIDSNSTSDSKLQITQAPTSPKSTIPEAPRSSLALQSNSNEKPSTAMSVQHVSQMEQPLDPQPISVNSGSGTSNASQVYQRILEARKKRRGDTGINKQVRNDVPRAVPLGETPSEQIVTGSIPDQRHSAKQSPTAKNQILGSADNLLTSQPSAEKPQKGDLESVLSNATTKSSRSSGFISVSGSLPPAEIGPMSLRVAAATGNPNAQFEVAARYTDGKIITQDFREAAAWYQKAAAKGLAPAQYRLGTFYEKGRGVPTDKAAARIWYERAAEKGNSKAMHNLAVIYADTNGGEPDFAKAALWFRSAAELGLTDSQYNYGILNERGLGVRPNLAEAYKWFSISAQNGDKGAKSRLPQLEKKLSPEELIRAKLDAENWQAREPVLEANNVATPEGGWGSVKAQSPQLSDTRRSIASTQSMLNDMGYLAGPADGVLGPRTRDAIRKFQRDSGIPATGMVTRDLLQKLTQQAG